MRTAVLVLACSLPAVLAGTNAFGKKFLEENKARAGVTTLPSGLQYKVLRDGDGENHPLPDTSCECHYEGRTAQEWNKAPKGKKFDSSYDRGSPTSFAPSGVVAGWTEAMQLMVEGDQWELYLPSEMGYGDSGQGGDIGPGDVLVFTIEIIKINGASKEAQRGPPPYAMAATVAELKPLLAAGAPPLVLGLFRQPLKGKLQDGFKGAARGLKKAGWAGSTCLSAESKYDGKTKKFVPSEVETQYKLSAPGVYVSSDGGKAWTTCKTSHSQNSVSVADVTEKIKQCAAAAVTGKAEL
jgi:FKBP-type peptidyl-prolyl cis-trans isomerase FklB